MISSLRIPALVACLTMTIGLSLSACGDDGGIPESAVATVGEQSIKRSTFDHWMKIVAISAAQQTGGTAATVKVPDAPDFKQCVATKRKTAAKPAKGQPEQTDAQLKTACKTEYDGLKTQVLSYLIRATWLDQEAGEQGVKVTDKAVDKEITAARKQAQLEGDAYDKFLRGAGLTEADIFFQQRTTLLEQQISKKVTKGKDAVTAAEISAYYEKNKSQFAQPERRDLRIVLTKSEAKANAAKAALAAGGSWKAVAKEFSTDEATKGQSGQLLGVAEGQQEQALDKAAFAAAKGKLSGPIKTQFGWYVFEVTKITKGSQQTLKESEATIKQTLTQEKQQKAVTAFGKDYRDRYKKTTECRKDFVVDDCKNAPKAKTTSTGTGTATTGTATQP